jgi:hypothetical protein
MAPLPIVVPLPRAGLVPIHILAAMMLLPVPVVGLRLMVVPLVVILVLLIVKAVFIGMIAPIVMVRGLRE